MKTATVITGEISMDYFKFGNGAKNLVIIPGLSAESILNYADAVSAAYASATEDFTIYVIDRRSNVPESYTVKDMARDTLVAIDALGLSEIYLFGASQGGMISMEIAVARPELVKKLILGSTSSCFDEEHYNATVGPWVQMAKEGRAEDLYLSFGEALYPQAVFEQARSVLIESAKKITDKDLKKFIIIAEGIRGFDLTGDISKIACPVLVLGANDDNVVGGQASHIIYDQLAGRGDCEIYMYDGFGHAVYDLAPDYRERMLKFFLAGCQ